MPEIPISPIIQFVVETESMPPNAHVPLDGFPLEIPIQFQIKPPPAVFYELTHTMVLSPCMVYGSQVRFLCKLDFFYTDWIGYFS